MSAPTTLALLASDRVDDALEEFVRLCVGVVAGGGRLDLLEVGPGRGLLSSADDLPDELSRNLAGLADFGIQPRPVDADELPPLLAGCDHILRLGSPDRAGSPDLLALSDALLEDSEPDVLARQICSAGQVIRA